MGEYRAAMARASSLREEARAAHAAAERKRVEVRVRSGVGEGGGSTEGGSVVH